MIELNRVLVPTDFSKFSEHALQYAVAFAEKFGAELHLLHVVQDLALLSPDAVGIAPPLAPSLQQLSGAVESAFDRLIQAHQLDRFGHRRELREGTPWSEIVRSAKENEVDLIVMGTHGHTGLAHILLGSVTDKVIRHSPCPVLTIRHPEHEFIHA
jgi:nucleotide-binding universal stress UspA family protein